MPTMGGRRRCRGCPPPPAQAPYPAPRSCGSARARRPRLTRHLGPMESPAIERLDLQAGRGRRSGAASGLLSHQGRRLQSFERRLSSLTSKRRDVGPPRIPSGAPSVLAPPRAARRTRDDEGPSTVDRHRHRRANDLGGGADRSRAARPTRVPHGAGAATPTGPGAPSPCAHAARRAPLHERATRR